MLGGMPFDLSQDIRDRSFALACRVVRASTELPAVPGVRRIADQLVRSGTSIGANLEEAKAASSKKDFLNYVQISLKECRETKYWLRLCAELGFLSATTAQPLIGHADQVGRILGAIVISTKRRMMSGCSVFAFCILNLASLISE